MKMSVYLNAGGITARKIVLFSRGIQTKKHVPFQMRTLKFVKHQQEVNVHKK
jgi:hypothetical protein